MHIQGNQEEKNDIKLSEGWYSLMNYKPNTSTNGTLLAEDERAAQAMGLTYGRYKALSYTPSKPQNPPQPHQNRKPKQEYLKHLKRFLLWKKGFTDEEIASRIGVSRIAIVKWRDIMELPAARRCKDRYKYHLEETEYGIFAIHDE